MTDALHFDYPRWKIRNCWISVDANFHGGAGRLSLSLIPIKVANTLIMYCNNQIACELLTFKTKICWLSVDAHFLNGAGSMWLCLVPIKPGNTAYINGHNQLPCRLPMTQDQKLLTLSWHSFCPGHIHNMLSFNLAQYIFASVLAAFVLSSCTFSLITTLFFNNSYKYIL